MIMATEKTMTDLEDLNRTLYDIGAQDLLDVWEAMEAQVRKNIPIIIPIFFRQKL